MPYGVLDFPLEYKEACFYAWWKAGRPISHVAKTLPVAPDGRRPSIATVRKWMEGGEGWENWHAHADRLDAELSLKLDRDAINERAKILKKLAADGAVLIEKGMEFLEQEDPFKDNPAAAVRAIVAGIDIVSKYSGMAQSLIEISKMTPAQLEKEARRLLGQNENADNIIDAQEIQDGDTDSEDDNG